MKRGGGGVSERKESKVYDGSIHSTHAPTFLICEKFFRETVV
jgi:hypothetical protein